ncbi:MAG: hypothetical protein SFX73_24695 [Kofleriaceae bacterium]|nr:hypothetical protein [Kofleriaceae bacterium]
MSARDTMRVQCLYCSAEGIAHLVDVPNSVYRVDVAHGLDSEGERCTGAQDVPLELAYAIERKAVLS